MTQKTKKRPMVSDIAAVIVAMTFLLAIGCAGSKGCEPHDNGPKTMTQADAIQIAKSQVAKDNIMTIDPAERDTVVKDESGQWHVSFPYKISLNKLGGEPHVFVSKENGKILNVYYTQ